LKLIQLRSENEIFITINGGMKTGKVIIYSGWMNLSSKEVYSIKLRGS